MRFFLLLLFIPLAFSSQITIEREWKIPDQEGMFVDFQGALVVNNSHQKIIYIEHDGTIFQDEYGTIWIHFNKNLTSEKIRGKAIVEVNHSIEIQSDSYLPEIPVKTTSLTSYDEEMAAKAKQLATNSSLETIANLVNWVHISIDYDESYWDKVISAKETFQEKKGVCVQYTHLLISMANSLGFQTRYVTGYIYTDDWQPHVWAEIYVPSYGWLPSDATYGKIGNQDDHITIAYGRDQLSTSDFLISKINESSLSVDDTLSILQSKKVSQDYIDITFDEDSRLIHVMIRNNRPYYVFGDYFFETPYFNDSAILLLNPNQTMNRYYGVNRSVFSNSISVSASFNGESEKKNFVTEQPTACLPLFLLLYLLRIAL
ncbi:transglutaminase domain-containing protein [Candidatus Micrarchaeota archaeon]|nr:transglutaminase domain-containing protein [Candidatus Micrarchaeota archaeon]